MFDYPPKIHKQDLDHIKYLIESQMKMFLRHEKDDLKHMRGMIHMINEIGYEVEFKAEFKKR